MEFSTTTACGYAGIVGCQSDGIGAALLTFLQYVSKVKPSMDIKTGP